ncbi:hypothetical protein HMPREF3213_03065 [Heyndrickxia coagulans]|uniref:Uncharacterized protein n=1 Tax=Heyndrickxia coagulans TaxID=1398 RepID=A0A133KF84_HEYCO|nr:hypothetical protein HMPREF3213_03065 [Heyndrickxia coagulans]
MLNEASTVICSAHEKRLPNAWWAAFFDTAVLQRKWCIQICYFLKW